ncbi:MAG: inositol-3-phosphate synthase, partial [Acidobacteria bacterium]|nr:inositol-3-phosphate synthase [Acidobacteriota bacterium]
MAVEKGAKIAPAEGRLGVLLVGLGAVSTTFIAGVEAIKQGLAEPVGSLTQMGTIRLGKRTENRVPMIKDFVPLADLKDLVFGAWDIFPDSAYEAAMQAGVLEKELLAQLRTPLQKIKPMRAVFDQQYVKRLNGTNVKEGANKLELAEQLIDEIAEWKRKNKCQRLVMIWAASTEIFLKPHPVHRTLKSFEQAMRDNHKAIAPSMIYAYAALRSGVPFANGAPNLTIDVPALTRLAEEKRVPVCGKDFKTGQTLMKTILAPGLKSRMLGLHGWYSTNILGNRDGEVLDDPESFKTKEESKLSVLEYILQP